MTIPENLEKIIPLIESGIKEALNLKSKEIKSLKNFEEIDAISLDIFPSPYQKFFSISLRNTNDYKNEDFTSDNDLRYSSGDWEYYNFINIDNSDFDKFINAGNKIFSLYSDLEKQGLDQEEITHLILIIAASALLSPKTAEALTNIGISAPELTKRPNSYTFEYIVMDEDLNFKFNYCEHVIASRMTDDLITKLKE